MPRLHGASQTVEIILLPVRIGRRGIGHRARCPHVDPLLQRSANIAESFASGTNINTLARRTFYAPYGETLSEAAWNNAPADSKGWIGERAEPDAGLIYLNARWYDPSLSRFTRLDKLDPIKRGVGPDQYGYAGGDPVNNRDPIGEVIETGWDLINVAYDLAKVGYGYAVNNQDLQNEGLVDLAVDVAAALVPGLPAGASKLARGIAKAVTKVDTPAIGKAADKIANPAGRTPPGRRGAFRAAKLRSWSPRVYSTNKSDANRVA
ncbi:RHS repeat-associated core domain-containing protein [Segnochrobactraceae bacterium EtOH-i3]